MAYVKVYYHRDPGRIGPHVRYIATRDGACGLQGLGPDFRALRGDVERAVTLLRAHAEQARARTHMGPREGPFVRLLFTLPNELAARVADADARLPEGARLVLRDALEATFRSAGRHLQGVYAIHFHAARREAHGHVHVDLSALDRQARPTFVTRSQQERLRDAWTREVERALERQVRRAQPVREAATEAAPLPAPERRPARREQAESVSPPSSAGAEMRDRRRYPLRPRRSYAAYLPWVAGQAFGWNRPPTLADLLLRALARRASIRWRPSGVPLAVSLALGWPVPRVRVQVSVPHVARTFGRLPLAP